jgi:hypothetical protein
MIEVILPTPLRELAALSGPIFLDVALEPVATGAEAFVVLGAMSGG